MIADNRGPVSGYELRRARRVAELTQAELAQRLDVRLWIIDQWESGARPIPEERRSELAAATGWQPPVSREPSPAPVAAAGEEELRATPDVQSAAEEYPELQPELVSPTMEPVEDTWLPDRELPRALRGYEPAAVHALLGELAAVQDKLVADLSDATSRAAQLEDQARAAEARAGEAGSDVPDLREQEDLIRDAIMTAQKAANEVREEARRSAADVLHSARRRAEQIVAEAEKERARLEKEINRLEQLAETSRAAVREFLSSLLDQVNPVASAEHNEADADLDRAIFEHEFGKVAEPSGTETKEEAPELTAGPTNAPQRAFHQPGGEPTN